MSEFVSQDPDREASKTTPLLRDILAQATFQPGRAISPQIDTFDLGVFGEEARILAYRCFEDESNSDHGKFVYVTGKKKVLLPAHTFKAANDLPLGMIAAASAVPRDAAERIALDDRYLAMVMHTASNRDRPLSISGTGLLLVSDSSPFGVSCIFVAGKTQNYLVFRGETTPQLSEKEVEQKTKLWGTQIENRVRRFMSESMDIEERLSIVVRAEGALFRQICQRYGLIYFTSPAEADLVTKQLP